MRKIIFLLASSLVIMTSSCRSPRTDNNYAEYYDKMLKQWTPGDKALEVIEALTDKAKKDEGFNEYFQKRVLQEPSGNRRFSLLCSFHRHYLLPSSKLIHSLLYSNDIGDRCLGLLYAEYSILRFEKKIFEISKNDKNEKLRNIANGTLKSLANNRAHDYKFSQSRPVQKPKSKN
jgi:hypothetical protein